MQDKKTERSKAMDRFLYNAKLVFSMCDVSQTKMATLIGVSKQTMHNWTARITPMPFCAYISCYEICHILVQKENYLPMLNEIMQDWRELI